MSHFPSPAPAPSPHPIPFPIHTTWLGLSYTLSSNIYPDPYPHPIPSPIHTTWHGLSYTLSPNTYPGLLPRSPSSPLTLSYTTSLNLTLEPISPAQTSSGPSRNTNTSPPHNSLPTPTGFSTPLPNEHSPNTLIPLDNFSAVYNTNLSYYENFLPPPARTPTPPCLPPKVYIFRHLNKDKD